MNKGDCLIDKKEVNKEEIDKSYNNTTPIFGDDVVKKNQTEIGLKIFFTFLAVYGFLAFLNPIEFPVTRILLEGTELYSISQFDRIFGLVFLVIGLYLLLEK